MIPRSLPSRYSSLDTGTWGENESWVTVGHGVTVGHRVAVGHGVNMRHGVRELGIG